MMLSCIFPGINYGSIYAVVFYLNPVFIDVSLTCFELARVSPLCFDFFRHWAIVFVTIAA